MDEIIFAKSSGAGLAAISIVRLTGAGSHALIARLIKGNIPQLRLASLRRLYDPENQAPLDDAVIILFAENASYTGEESAELHLHGGEAVSAAVFDVLERLGARLAQPGEFSRRALQSGALDLAQAEAVGAVIAAETQIERRQALRGLQGEVGELAGRWRETLISLIGLLETGVDFVEEALGEELIEEARLRLEVFRTEISVHVEESGRVELRRDRPEVALIGPPNAGKSSLLNAVAGVERAIVSSTPGTTRDVVDLSVRVAGQEIVLSDTAGIRESADEIEKEGIARSRKAMTRSDRRIFVVSTDTWESFLPLLSDIRPGDAVFWTKTDIAAPDCDQKKTLKSSQIYQVSAKEPHYIRRAVEKFLSATAKEETTPLSPLIGSDRRISLLSQSDKHLEAALSQLEEGSIELAIEELRKAATRFEAMTGAIDQEDVLDVLFSRFCIGK